MKHYHKNPRQITKQQMQDLAKDLKALGDLSGITHDLETDEILTGNQRCEALPGVMSGLVQPEITQRFAPPLADGTAMLGYYIIDGKMYNYRAVTGWDDKQREQANIVANRRGGSWDFDILANSFELPDLIEWGFDEHELAGYFDGGESKDAEPQISRADELQEIWQVQTGDLWQIGEHRLVCGDCTDPAVVARVMGGEKARMIFTDPPWNVAIGKDSNPRHRQREGLQNDDMSDEEYESFVSSFISSFVSVCDGDVYCKVASEYMDIIGGIFRAEKYHWSATVIWVKDIFVLGRSKYHRRYEPIWYGWHEKSKSSFCDARNLDDVWEIKRPRMSDEHPTMMPVELPTRAIGNSSNAGDIVYEPFLGSGTTLVACENLGRRGRGIEISPAYCAVTLERMSAAFPELEIKRVD